jgi:hypothetical protein
VTRRIADLLGNSVATQKSQLAGVARDRGVQLLARGEEGPGRDSAIARLRRADSVSSSILGIQIWDAAGAVVLPRARSREAWTTVPVATSWPR